MFNNKSSHINEPKLNQTMSLKWKQQQKFYPNTVRAAEYISQLYSIQLNDRFKYSTNSTAWIQSWPTRLWLIFLFFFFFVVLFFFFIIDISNKLFRIIYCTKLTAGSKLLLPVRFVSYGKNKRCWTKTEPFVRQISLYVTFP
jgi:hypothetical protein